MHVYIHTCLHTYIQAEKSSPNYCTAGWGRQNLHTNKWRVPPIAKESATLEVYMYVCMYVCIYIAMYFSTNFWVCMYVHIHIYTQMACAPYSQGVSHFGGVYVYVCVCI
jgi:hypothetical protein